jgi:two-component system NtrC family sensor kinase
LIWGGQNVKDTTMQTPRILILEDNPADAELEIRELRQAGVGGDCAVVTERAGFVAALAEKAPDLVVSDYSLPDFDGVEALRIVGELSPDTPVVICTGSVNEQTAISCLKSGAADYILKDRISRLGPACVAALERARERRERRLAEEALQESERRLRTLVETAQDAILSADEHGRVIFWNPGAVVTFGYSAEEALGRPITDLMPERFREAHAAAFAEQAEDPDAPLSFPGISRLVALRRNGTEFPVEVSLSRWTREGRPVFSAILRDISERTATEAAIEALSHLHELILHSAGEGILGMDREGRATFVNPAGLALAGRSLDEILGADVHALLHHTDAEGRHHTLAECPVLAPLRTGEPFAGRALFWRGNGDSFTVQVSAMPMSERGEIRGAVMVFEDVTEQERSIALREEAERALRRSEAKYRSLVDRATLGIYRSTREDLFISVNPALVEMMGYASEEEVLALRPEDVYEDPEARGGLFDYWREKGQIDGLEVRWRRKDGRFILVRLTGVYLRDEETGQGAFQLIAEDISDRRALEEQLRQAQKMEAVGQLTSGIAHDFNNVLCVISLSAQLAAGALASGEPVDPEDIDGIQEAARRAARITQQLLGFSRKAELSLQPVELSAVVDGLADMIRTAVPENIRIRIRAERPAGTVRADPSTLDQIVLNLVTNSRDAMPEGGTLGIEVMAQELDEVYCETHPGVKPGPYACISVSDTGIGMSEEVRARVFEPFFTTKPVGVGTGLGLAMVYGLAKQQGGSVWVYSEPGQGTTIKVFFPIVDDPAGQSAGTASDAKSLDGTETVLLVEDEPGVRTAAERTLRRHGYSVITAENGQQALDVYERQGVAIDLVISDVVMPKMDGRRLLEALRARDPRVKIILASGYSGGAAPSTEEMEGRVPLLRKPWDVTSLLTAVRHALDSDPPTAT